MIQTPVVDKVKAPHRVKGSEEAKAFMANLRVLKKAKGPKVVEVPVVVEP